MKHLKLFEGFHAGDLKNSIESSIQNPEMSMPIALVGDPKFPKTSMIGKIASENNLTMIFIDCEIASRKGSESIISSLPQDNGYNDRGGVIVFDNVDMASSSVEMFVYKLATQRNSEGYSLPNKWIVILNDHHGSSSFDGRFTVINV